MDPQAPFYVEHSDPPAKRAALLVGLKLFAERGIDGVTVRDIAHHTGFTNPALFRHYAGKDALALALFERCYRRLLGVIQGGRRRDGLRGALTGSLALIDESPEAVHYVLENLRRFFHDLPAELRATSILGEMRDLVAAEQQAGRVAAQIDVGLAAAMVLGTLASVEMAMKLEGIPHAPGGVDAAMAELVAAG